MSTAPFMQLYVADYLGDTQHLTTEQHGAYLLLLMTMWRAGGSLPDDDTKLARIVRLTPARWRRIKGDVIAFFETEDGRLTQKRLAAELKKTKEKSEVRAVAGHAGGVAKSLKTHKPAVANATSLSKHSSDIIYHKEEDTSSLRSDVCVEPQAARTPEARKSSVPDLFPSPVFISIPTNRFATVGEEVDITEAKVTEYESTYPAIDVRQQLRQIRQWSIDKPDRRKTRRGIPAFVNSWLAREQNKGGNRTYDNGGNGTYHNVNNDPGEHPARAAARAVIAELRGGGAPEVPD